MMILFMVSMSFCLYTYALFPLVLHWRAKRVKSRRSAPANRQVRDAATPSAPEDELLARVSIVIAAHNEAKHLPAKIASLDALDYPKDLLECHFVSDGSTDETVDLLTHACALRENWSVHHYSPGAGKPTALNLGVKHATGEFLVFMDARQTVSANAVRVLVNRLNDPDVGVVSGELILTDENGVVSGQVGLYWRYEKWIRENESTVFSTTGATGALYAIRRGDYSPVPVDALLDDFDIPVTLLRQGKRTVFEPLARVYDRPEAQVSGEFRRKARTLAGNFQSFARHSWMFDPAQNPVWWQFLSHKVFRLFVPYALLLALYATVFGSHEFLRVMLAAQLAFYTLGMLGMLGVSNRITSVINLFLQLNAAAVVGAYRAIRGGSAVRWKSS